MEEGEGKKMVARVLRHYLAGMNIIHIDGFDTFGSGKSCKSFFKRPDTAIAFYLLSSLLSVFYEVNLPASSVIVLDFPPSPVHYSKSK